MNHVNDVIELLKSLRSDCANELPGCDAIQSLDQAIALLGGMGVESPEALFDHYIQTAIDNSPEKLRRLGEYLVSVLDEDQWPTAERLLNGLSVDLFHPPTQTAAVPEEWRIVEKKTCFALHRGNEVIATLAGPDAEENAAIIAQAFTATPSQVTVPDGFKVWRDEEGCIRLDNIEHDEHIALSSSSIKGATIWSSVVGRYFTAVLDAAPAPVEKAVPDEWRICLQGIVDEVADYERRGWVMVGKLAQHIEQAKELVAPAAPGDGEANQ